MLQRTIVLSFVISIFTAYAAFAQDRDALEDILRWFPSGETGSLVKVDGAGFIETHDWEAGAEPGGIYEKYAVAKIVHCDIAGFAAGCPREIREGFVTPGMSLLTSDNNLTGFRMAGGLPASLRDRYDSFTKADYATLGIKITEEIAEDGTVTRVNRKCSFEFEANGHHYCAWLPTRSLFVYRFADLDTLLQQALKEGELEPLDERPLYNRPIYHFPGSGQGSKLYAYDTDSQELLVAVDLGDLVNMVRAGMSYRESVTEALDLSRLAAVSPGCDLWTYSSDTTMYGLLLDYLSQKDPRSPSVEAVERIMETERQCMLNEYWWSLDGERCHRMTFTYGSAETADREYRNLLNLPDRNEFLREYEIYLLDRAVAFRPSVRRLNGARSEMDIELEGESIVITRADDAKTMLRMLEVLKELKREAEEKEREQARQR